ncbi:substrate-binding domain-containing protein [Sulfuritalea hydrogenivorans]|uniref:Molybdate ABC transporter periplasmic protein n=1 Tax=Sulfuritalea hydrogenivorans sk43H TaxID=1223802 RepID=W0SDA5_9PROT|nr:substrate-binding domain-containing protein [Sulfuritalea hydrogenivorans]BAO29036.1 molybdate ABC transporter periplasmic protein [Sulfuritalea hydrogenivorans sk43H]
MQTPVIRGISSMATRQVLAELAAAYRMQRGVAVSFESVGGVDAAKRVQAGEPFDLVVLAADAIDRLVASGHVVADSKADLVRSTVAIAVRAGAARPDVGSEGALRRAVLAAKTLGYSTGPSGTELMKLFERWGIADEVRERVVQAPPGVPVAQLVAEGKVELGFQQYSEMAHAFGIAVVGTMPPGCEIVSTFAGALCAASTQPEAVRDLLDFMRSPEAALTKRRQGMEPA